MKATPLVSGILCAMAWWITVYCRAPVSALTPAQLLAGIRDQDRSAPAGVDYRTLAEHYDIDDAAMIDAALDVLRVRPAGSSGLDCEVCHRPEEDARPIVVHCWSDPERVAEEVTEAEAGRSPPTEALARLRTSKEIVAIELGFSQLEDMGIVLAYEIARWLAQKGNGLVVDDDDCWLAVEGGGSGRWVDP
jgi:hypothetical protein